MPSLHMGSHTPPLPTAWQDAPTGANVPVTDWWTGFHDPMLERLENEALNNGPDVQLAYSRLRQARAQSHSTVAQYLPQLTLTGQGQYTHSMGGNTLPSATGGAPETQQMIGSWGPSISWEVPLFGRIGPTIAGARANNRIALADLRGVRVSVAADVAQAYVDLRAAQASYVALQKSVASADQLATILETGVTAGFTSPSDAANARRLAETARARLAGLEIEARRAENVLAVLRGVTPGMEAADVQQVFDADSDVPSLTLTEAPAAPADLLRLRPDVASAEAEVLLSAAAVGEARADLLPQLNITGMLSATSNIIGSQLPDAATREISGTPIISLPLFDWGQRYAQVGVRHQQFEQSLITYRQTVTEAVAEASNALISLTAGQRALVASRTAERAAEVSDRGSKASYEAGIQSLADRLQVEQQLIDATLSRIDAEHQQASAAISVYRAFGGGPAVTSH